MKVLSAVMFTSVLLAGCPEVPLPIDPLVIPPAADIEYINVSRRNPDGSERSEFKIWDRQKIEAIAAELRMNNTGYFTEMDKQVPQEYSVALNGREGMATMVWIAHDWLGGVDSEHEDSSGGLASHFRKLDAEQHRRLLLLLRQPLEGSE